MTACGLTLLYEIHAPRRQERNKLILEIGLRCIVYILIFMLVSLLFDMKPSVSYWRGQNALLFGTTYFGALALIDSQRYFSKAINTEGAGTGIEGR